jgi:hypothetical protein
MVLGCKAQGNAFDGGEDMNADPERKHGVSPTEPGKKEYEKPQLLVYESLQAMTGGTPSNPP